ncbi:single-stranded DNA-binding protein [Sphingobacterium mizutaii]|uniref:single-stranded DNA-binding protein n=1 Tax=Sphingobacterium mizutaii TaxID=1010 RepID=UPI0028A194BD|nr:single-stranded DNA-binding protein [Sphingobacterium mizutaii]
MSTIKNSVQLLGRLGQEAEIKISSTGIPYCFISLVTNEYGVKKNGEQYEKSQWHRIAVWGNMLCNQMKKRGKKGSLWLIQGTIFYKQFEKESGNTQQYCEIRANKLMFLMEGMGLNQKMQPEISA